MPVINLPQFLAGVRKFSDEELLKLTSQFTRRIALEVLVSIIQNTPVDTGRAKGAWHVSLESPSESIRSSVEKLKTGGRKITKAESVKLGSIVRKEGLATIGGHKPFGAIYINNNVDYILYLEEGTAKITAFAMAANAVNEVAAKFR